MNIAILGAGYIGAELACLWTQKGYHVTVTTRHSERLEELSPCVKECVILKGTNENELTELVIQNDPIIVTIAADSPEEYEIAYLRTAQILRQIALENELIRCLIYTSSTSVYGDHHGLWVDEMSKLLAKTDQGKILIETERLFQSLQKLGWHVCILRLAEIYGPGRAIAERLRSLKGKTPGDSENNYTNMVHRDDVIAAIDYALRHRLEGIYNLSDDDHSTRKELYNHAAQILNIPQVQWDSNYVSLHGSNKRVSNHKIKAAGFSLLHPHRLFT